MARYKEFKGKLPVQIHQLKTMTIKRIIDRTEDFLLSLTLSEIASLYALNIWGYAGPPGFFMIWNQDKRSIKHLSDREGKRFWLKHLTDTGLYSGEPNKEFTMSFDFSQCQGFACPFRFVPTYLNHDVDNIKQIIVWRLQLGR